MARTKPFDEQPNRYDDWFDRHEAAYQSELAAVQALWPDEAAEALEIGVGTGRFAAPLGIQHGVDPSPAMRDRARARGITVTEGVAEALPYPDARFDAALMTTTLCYLDDPAQAFREAFRVLRPGGAFIVAFIDRDGPLGQRYAQEQATSAFYHDAQFHATDEVTAWMTRAGFTNLEARQTLFGDPDAMDAPDSVRSGTGEGGFVVLRGLKPPAFS